MSVKTPHKKILILDTGKEWGGGTNSLLELLKRVDRRRYGFSALFYDNYRMGEGTDVRGELKKLGVELIVLQRQRSKAYAKALKEAGRALLFLSPALKKRYVFYLDYATRILPDSRRIAQMAKEMGVDLIYMNNQPSSNLEGIIAAKSQNIPCIQHSRIEVVLNPFEAASVNGGVSKVICVSAGVRDSLIKSGVSPGKCTVVYNGIDSMVTPAVSAPDIRATLGVADGEYLIGTVGSLIKRKRMALLLEAMAHLLGMPLKCVVVGEGPLRASLKAEAERLGVGDSVIFTGFKGDALSYINAMDIFVLPSAKEGLPRVILEAMLMGRPVIAFDITGSGELVADGRTGVLLKDNDRGGASIAGAIKGLLTDASLMRSMGAAGRKRVTDEFSVDRYVEGVERVFKEVLHKEVPH